MWIKMSLTKKLDSSSTEQAGTTTLLSFPLTSFFGYELLALNADNQLTH